MTTPRTTPTHASKSGRRHATRTPTEQRSGDGYDADGGDPETGLDTANLALESEQDEADGEAGLSLDTEDLGPRMLQNAMQSDGAGHTSASFGSGISEPGGLDMTRDVIDEGSLFDQPRDELGGTRHPQIRTNEVDATLERNQRASRERLKQRSARRR